MAKKTARVNDRIKSSPVRLIGPGGEQIGILPLNEAKERAFDANLDLVEISPNSNPPVCRIMDYGKFMYEQSKKAKQAKKKQHVVQMKEMRYRPKIEEHDYRFKTNHVREFLEQGNKVRLFVRFAGREMAHTEYGKKILIRIAEELEDISTVGQEPKLDGRRMTMILNPKTSAMKPKN
ncbi:MAG: translation initiation factor IF-3 [Candidatus Zixiibacteriota bacterium]|nr:MAG: translation initiation factor IF-3 [candidate division Zixibacteria bacterium]HHI02421.1 translation initiation factor IF-3 [candidate division Zixibacteria bacterium]